MRLSILMFVFALSSSLIFAQHEDEPTEPDMMNVLEPNFTGTHETVGIHEFLQENISYPKNAYEWGIEGTVAIQFKVLPTGDLSEFLVINSVFPKCDKAVIRALEATNGMWNPGTINGHPVTMEKEVTVAFKFEGNEMYKTAQSYAVMADKAFKKGKYSRATKLYNRAIGIYPNHALMLYQRGLAKYYNGDSNGALSDFERSVYLGGHIAEPLMARLLEDEKMQKIGIN